ncbi:hypothetical protein AQUCO_07200123v1 [Aquilegia coerulea]|uniref:Uncharacterized protein n=1 Tax=Aquilegia coerulea TaxID=218851 RepID=A0A2G5CAE9_AQUCA|nr:hypothetical protein AQUCO_07200123v1 [Aquilegia coerulea]
MSASSIPRYSFQNENIIVNIKNCYVVKPILLMLGGRIDCQLCAVWKGLDRCMNNHFIACLSQLFSH